MSKSFRIGLGFFQAALSVAGLATVVGQAPAAGPDVTVCNIPNGSQRAREGAYPDGIVAISFASTIGNHGADELKVEAFPDLDHPAVVQNFYRLSTVAGTLRFEQIGQSWARHEYCVLAQNTCWTCTPGATCVRLGTGCSSSSTSASEADKGALSARSWINPYAGTFPSAANPPPLWPGEMSVDRRLQVSDANLAPALNPGATYYIEHQYVAADDSVAGNQFDNLGYRRITVSGPDAGGVYGLAPAAATVNYVPALSVWSGASQSLAFPVAGDGLVILAYQVTDLSGAGDGPWHYEYLLYNMNLGAALNAFEVPLPGGVELSNIDAHYVANHGIQATGQPFSNDPWTVDATGGRIRWSTVTQSADPNANALRWGTAFNFRFDANRPPRSTAATLGVYAGGAAAGVSTQGPTFGLGDMNCDGAIDILDINPFTLALGDAAAYAAAYPDCDVLNADINGDGEANVLDINPFIAIVAGG